MTCQHLFRTEANATSLIPLDTILPGICAFIIGFTCTVWITTMSLACSLADSVLPTVNENRRCREG